MINVGKISSIGAQDFPQIDAGNSTSIALTASSTFTGSSTKKNGNGLMLVVQSSHECTAWIEFSLNNVDWSQTPPAGYKIKAGVNEIHTLQKGDRFYRLKITNTSGVNMTYLRAQVFIYGVATPLTSPINTTIQGDADAQIVRPLDFNIMVAEGLYENRMTTLKDGYNPDVDSTALPEDIISQGGVYAGFPVALPPEDGEIVVVGADTGIVLYAYLASKDDTDYTFGTKAVAGAGTYSLGHPVWRSNFMYFISNNPLTTNVDVIRLRNTVTTSNIFCEIPAGVGQSYCSAYTVPKNSSIYIDRITGTVRGSNTGSMDGFFYYRDSINGGYRLRFPFELQFGALYFDDVDYTIKVPQGVDLVPRITFSSANNLVPKISYRIVKVLEV